MTGAEFPAWDAIVTWPLDHCYWWFSWPFTRFTGLSTRHLPSGYIFVSVLRPHHQPITAVNEPSSQIQLYNADEEILLLSTAWPISLTNMMKSLSICGGFVAEVLFEKPSKSCRIRVFFWSNHTENCSRRRFCRVQLNLQIIPSSKSSGGENKVRSSYQLIKRFLLDSIFDVTDAAELNRKFHQSSSL